MSRRQVCVCAPAMPPPGFARSRYTACYATRRTSEKHANRPNSVQLHPGLDYLDESNIELRMPSKDKEIRLPKRYTQEILIAVAMNNGI
ncbi:MAG: hypothetical protein ACLP5V_00805 [Candidatus Bathyarchaeia archaeon]